MGGGITCERGLVGDSLNDEQRSNDLPSCRMRQPTQESESWESTNLGLSQDTREDICERALGSPRSNDQHRAHSEQGRRLDEYGSDGLVQPTDSG